MTGSKRWTDILLDLDGTITESAPGIIASVQYALGKLGVAPPPDFDMNRVIGPPLDYSFTTYFGLPAPQAEEAMTLYREYYAGGGMFENQLYPGIPALLEELQKAGKILSLATSKPEPYARSILDHFGLTRRFTHITGSVLGRHGNSKGEVVAKALTKGVDPAAAIMVGDRHHDVEGARENGIPCVGVLYGYGSREELEKAGADYLTDSVETLGRLLLPGADSPAGLGGA